MHSHLWESHAKFLTTIQSVDAGWKISSAVNAAETSSYGVPSPLLQAARVSKRAYLGWIRNICKIPFMGLPEWHSRRARRVGHIAGHDLTCLREPTLVAVDEEAWVTPHE